MGKRDRERKERLESGLEKPISNKGQRKKLWYFNSKRAERYIHPKKQQKVDEAVAEILEKKRK